MRRGHVNGGSQHESLGFGSTSRQIRIKQGALNFVCTQYNYKSKKCSRKIQLRLPICWHNLAIFERPVCPRQCRRRPTPTATPTAPHFRSYITYSTPGPSCGVHASNQRLVGRLHARQTESHRICSRRQTCAIPAHSTLLTRQLLKASGTCGF